MAEKVSIVIVDDPENTEGKGFMFQWRPAGASQAVIAGLLLKAAVAILTMKKGEKKEIVPPPPGWVPPKS